MTRRYVHYESAFEDYLRSEGVPYVPVNEAKRAIFAGTKVKSFDFLVHGRDTCRWLADVKGRRFPYNHVGRRRYWENWVTREDLDSLRCWEETFGEPFRAAFVFAYWLEGTTTSWPATTVHPHRGRYYGFMAVTLSDYLANCRLRSARWNTYWVSGSIFRRLARPVNDWWRAATRQGGLPNKEAVYNDGGAVQLAPC